MPDDREQIVRQRAYQIWLEDGRPSGRDKEHWCQAEAELVSGIAPPILQHDASGDAGGVQPPSDAPVALVNPGDLQR